MMTFIYLSIELTICTCYSIGVTKKLIISHEEDSNPLVAAKELRNFFSKLKSLYEINL